MRPALMVVLFSAACYPTGSIVTKGSIDSGPAEDAAMLTVPASAEGARAVALERAGAEVFGAMRDLPALILQPSA